MGNTVYVGIVVVVGSSDFVSALQNGTYKVLVTWFAISLLVGVDTGCGEAESQHCHQDGSMTQLYIGSFDFDDFDPAHLTAESALLDVVPPDPNVKGYD